MGNVGKEKFSSGDGRLKMENGRTFSIFYLPFSVFIALILISQFCAGCKTPSSMPPANLSAPGWTVLRGQAIWSPPRDRPEIAGDLILATNVDGSFLIQFSKSPLTLATAQVENNEWEIRLGNDKYAWRGGGVPPDRFLWFQLPRALLGQPMTDDWKFDRSVEGLWRLQNSKTHEKLEGEFFQ